MRKEIGRYACVGDDRKRYTVVELHNLRKFQPIDGPAEYIPTTKEWFLSTGEDVNQLEDGNFKTVLSEVSLTRI
ncbi:hypothetical protein [Mesorhizobium sp. M0195]|uniref:hypothetical protein n=1 Tax=Mesorhizobium sp. M0195 TaxID=2956910 RepID=UPI003338B550